MTSALKFVFIFVITGASTIDNFEADEVPIQNVGTKLRSAISGGIIPMDDEYYNFHQMPYQNGGQQEYLNYAGNPHGMNSYGKYPGSYYDPPWNRRREKSAWEWIQDVLSYCFGHNRNYGYNGYDYRTDNDHYSDSPRGNRLAFRKRSTIYRRKSEK